MNRFFVCTFFLILAVTPPTANAHSLNYLGASIDTADEKKSADAEKRKKREKLFQVLEQTLTEAQSLALAENQIRIQATALKLLWKSDPQRAKELTNGVLASLCNLAPQVNGLTQGNIQQEDECLEARERVFQAYVEILRETSAANPDLALNFLETTRATISEPDNLQNTSVLDQLEYEFETAAAQRNPQKLYQAARKPLAKGGYSKAASLISSIGDQDPKLASQLVMEIVAKLQNDAPRQNSEAIFATHLIAQLMESVPAQNDSANLVSASSSSTANIKIDEATRRNFFTFIANSALEDLQQQNDGIFFIHQRFDVAQTLHRYFHEMSRYAPKQAATLKSSLGKDLQIVAASQRKAQEYQRLLTESSPETLIKAADSATQPNEAEQLIQAAAIKFLDNGDSEKAKRLISEKISDAKTRNFMLRTLERQIYEAVSAQGKDDEAWRLLERFGSLEEKIAFLCERAAAAVKKKDMDAARMRLEQAFGLTGGGRAINLAQLRNRVKVAEAYAEIDVEKTFEILDPCLDHLNELIEATATLSGFSPYDPSGLKDGEINLTAAPAVSEFTLLAVQSLSAAAKSDIERTRPLLNKFRRLEIRTDLQIRIVESLIPSVSADASHPDIAQAPSLQKVLKKNDQRGSSN